MSVWSPYPTLGTADSKLQQIAIIRQEDIVRLNALSLFANGLTMSLSEGASPTPIQGTGTFWVASATGTLNGQAYEQGDLLWTVNSGGTQKTALLANFSAL